MSYKANALLLIFLIFKVYLFSCVGSSLLCRLLSGCGKQGVLSRCAMGFSLWRLLWLQSTGSRVNGLQCLWHMDSVVATSKIQNTGSIVVANRLSSSVACGIFLDLGFNWCLLHWQADSSPLSHQENPSTGFPWVIYLLM